MAGVAVFFRSRSDAALEVFALRQQVAGLGRKRPRPVLNSFDRLFWAAPRHGWSRWADVLVIVKPETVIGWHRAGFRLYWRWRSRSRGGGPKITEEIRVLIRRLDQENPNWGAPKIHGNCRSSVGSSLNEVWLGIFGECVTEATLANAGWPFSKSIAR